MEVELPFGSEISPSIVRCLVFWTEDGEASFEDRTVNCEQCQFDSSYADPSAIWLKVYGCGFVFNSSLS